MAKKMIPVFEDDLTGEELTEHATVKFAVDGVGYEFDTSPDNAEVFYRDIGKYVSAARRVTATGRTYKRVKVAETGGVPARLVREWAIGQGMSVPSKGRIPADVREAYDAAH